MSTAMVLEMAASVHPERLAVGRRAEGMTYERLAAAAAGGATVLVESGAQHVVFVGVNGPVLPVLTFAAAWAGIPIAPLSYRLPADQLRALIARLTKPLIVADPAYLGAFDGAPSMSSVEFLALAEAAPRRAPAEVPDSATAVVLFTSGTSAAPKGVLLRHENLTSYVLQTVEFGSADEAEAALISTPPYHIAGMGTVLTNVYAGRRMVHLPDFSPRAWLELVRDEEITSAMVVPTMLARIVEHLDGAPAELPSLRSLAYGGARMPQPVLEKALAALPTTGFVNAYGLTETSSTIAVLGPDDHRAAATSSDPAVRARLSSAGRLVPGVEAEIRRADDIAAEPGEVGLLWVRGGQVSGEYLERGSVLDDRGWFPTNDRAWFDDEGFLFVGGRADDTIIRGGENIAPGEIEDVLIRHPQVHEVAVVGLPDDEWGERIAAAVVLRSDEQLSAPALQKWARERLRGTRTPDEVLFFPELPRNAMGKLVRRELVARIQRSRSPTG
jgi:acyl-CoA synthetase (AMP-forming)/AMP-acid ligase II